jgi:hypothetical protein
MTGHCMGTCMAKNLSLSPSKNIISLPSLFALSYPLSKGSEQNIIIVDKRAQQTILQQRILTNLDRVDILSVNCGKKKRTSCLKTGYYVMKLKNTNKTICNFKIVCV